MRKKLGFEPRAAFSSVMRHYCHLKVKWEYCKEGRVHSGSPAYPLPYPHQSPPSNSTPYYKNEQRRFEHLFVLSVKIYIFIVSNFPCPCYTLKVCHRWYFKDYPLEMGSKNHAKKKSPSRFIQKLLKFGANSLIHFPMPDMVSLSLLYTLCLPPFRS